MRMRLDIDTATEVNDQAARMAKYILLYTFVPTTGCQQIARQRPW